jgi:hypothetical protein
MARKRMIDPSFWTDEKLGECSIQERYLFMGLVSNADDEGYGRANPKLLKSSIFPYDDLRASDLEKWLSRLGGLKLVVLYTVKEQAYYYLPNFLKHQIINKPTKSQYPSTNLAENTTTESLLDDYGSDTVGLPPKRKEENRIEKNILCIFFESVWQLYPLKKGKGQVSDTQKEKLYKIGLEELCRCIERYKKVKPDWQNYQNGSTFLNSGYVDYLDKNYKGPEPEQSKYPDLTNYNPGV